MSEIRLTPGSSPAPILSGSGSATPTSAPAVTTVAPAPAQAAPAVSLGGALAEARVGDRLEGVVIGENSAGMPILRTAGGSFVIQTDQAVPQNSRLVLQVVGGGNPIQAEILMQDGVPLQPPPPVQLTLLRPDIQFIAEVLAETAVDPTAVFTVIAHDARLSATVLPEPGAPAPFQVRQLPPGTSLVFRVSPEPPPPPQRQSAPSSASAPAAQPLVRTQAQVTSAPAAAVGGLSKESRIAPQAAPPGAPQPTAAVSLPPASTRSAAQPAPSYAAMGLAAAAQAAAHHAASRAALAANLPPLPGLAAATVGTVTAGAVVSGPIAGQVLIRTSFGLLSIATEAPLPVGLVLSLEVLSIAAPRLNRSAETVGDTLSRLSHDWPSLREAVQALLAADPVLGRSLVEDLLPRPESRLASSLLFFFAALRGASSNPWLGRGASERLEQIGRHDLARRLQEDFDQIAKLGQPAPQGQWRTLLVPLMNGNFITQIMLFARRHGGATEDGEREAGTRFVIDGELPTLGPIQLDGLVQAASFNLIVRTRAMLATEICRDIRAIFKDSLTLMQRRGAIAFESVAQFQFDPLDEVRRGSSGVAVVV